MMYLALSKFDSITKDREYSIGFEPLSLSKMKGIFMMGVVQFIRSLLYVAIILGAAGTLVEATGVVGREAAIAHQRGGVSFKWLNQQLVGGGK